MKSLRSGVLLAVSLLFFAVQSYSQAIPNGDFETWVGDSVLVGWITTNNDIIKPITKGAPHSGNFAAQGTVTQIPGFPIPLSPILIAGNSETSGIPVNTRPGAFTGWFKFVPATGSADQLFIDVALYQGGPSATPVGSAATFVKTEVSSFTQLSIPFFYFNNLAPDTAIIQFQIIDTSGTHLAVPGSFFVVDDIAFSGTSSVGSNPGAPLTYSLSQNYPNPFNPTTRIHFSLAKSGPTTLEVFDILGQKVARLAEGELAAGPHEVGFDGSRLSSGFYMYRIESGGFVETRRMVLLK